MAAVNGSLRRSSEPTKSAIVGVPIPSRWRMSCCAPGAIGSTCPTPFAMMCVVGPGSLPMMAESSANSDRETQMVAAARWTTLRKLGNRDRSASSGQTTDQVKAMERHYRTSPADQGQAQAGDNLPLEIDDVKATRRANGANDARDDPGGGRWLLRQEKPVRCSRVSPRVPLSRS